MSSLIGAKTVLEKNRNVVVSCSVNMFPRYPVLENKTVKKTNFENFF